MMLALQLGLLAPQIGIERPAAPQAGGIVALVAILSVLLVLAVAIRRALRGRTATARLFAFSVSVGNALMDVAAVLQPDRPSVESLEKGRTIGTESAHGAAVGDGRVPGPSIPPAANHGPYRRD